MSEKRFTFEYDDGQWGVPLFYDDGKKLCFDEVVDLLNEQETRIDLLEKGILDCLFEDKSIGMFAEDMELVR